jgi:3-oxoacyl-[acyl-carrier protein] reductase
LSFENKVAIITGAAQGIGAAYARQLAQLGVNVVLADINVAKARTVAAEISAAGGRGLVIETDVSSSASCNDCAQAAIGEFGGVDFLVNNAGMLLASSSANPAARAEPLHTIEEAYYHRVLAINMHSVLFMSRAVVESMKSRGGGAVVNTSSIASWQNSGIYSISKLGVNGITISLARELGEFGIRVNAIAPGPVRTEGMESVRSVEQLSQWARSRGHSTGDIPGPEFVARAGIFLLSEDAKLVSGQILALDGGIIVRP